MVAMVAKAFVTRAIALLLIVSLLSVSQTTHDSACSDGDGSLVSLRFVLSVRGVQFLIFMVMLQEDFEASLATRSILAFAGLEMFSLITVHRQGALTSNM